MLRKVSLTFDVDSCVAGGDDGVSGGVDSTGVVPLVAHAGVHDPQGVLVHAQLVVRGKSLQHGTMTC